MKLRSLWAALLAAVFLAASIRHDIGFFNVESVILNIIYLLVTVLFFGGSWNQKLSACLVNGIMCLLTENTVSYTFAWCKHIPVREVWRYRSCLFLLVAAVVGAGLLAAYIIRRWRREQALTPLQMLVMSFFPGIVVVLNIVLMVSGGSEVPSMMNMMLTFGLTIAVLIHLGIVQMVNDQMLLQLHWLCCFSRTITRAQRKRRLSCAICSARTFSWKFRITASRTSARPRSDCAVSRAKRASRSS